MYKHILYSIVLLFTSKLVCQNPYWVFPPNYVNFKTGQVLPLPSDISYTKEGNSLCNLLWSENISLELNNNTNNFNLHSLSSISQSYPQYDLLKQKDLPIFPWPQCSINYNGSLSEIKHGTLLDKGIGGQNPNVIAPFQINQNASNALKFTDGLVNTSDLAVLSIGYAVTGLKKILRKSDNTYVQGVKIYSIGHIGLRCYNLLIDANSNTSIEFDFGIPVWNYYTNGYNTTELELSPNEQFLAWGDIDLGYLYVYDFAKPVQIGVNPKRFENWNISSIKGLEFSKDSRHLFFSYTNAVNDGVGVIPTTFDSQTFSSIPNTSDLKNSQLELAIDGKIYGSNGTQLKGFSSEYNVDAYNLSNFTIYNVTNPINDEGVYTLIDQIDNLVYFDSYPNWHINYLSFWGGPKTFGDISTSQSIKSSRYINNINSHANVCNTCTLDLYAKEYISFLPGFSAPYGSVLKTEVNTSSDFYSPVNCTFGGNFPYARTGEEEKHNDEILAYPNPISSGFLNLNKTVESFNMTNTSGIEVLEGKNVDKINIDGLSKGLYLLHIDGKAMKVVIE